MKKSAIRFIIIMGIISPSFLFGQSEISDRLSISVSGGLSLPVFSYAGSNAAESASYGPENIYPFLIGFSKEKNGFAKTGSYYNLEVKYKTAKRWFFLLRGGQFTNEVGTDNLSEFLTDDIYNFPVNVEHVDYNIFYITPGVGYAFTKNAFEFDIIVLSGYTRCNYPYYISTIEYISVQRYWSHRGEKPDLESFALGASFSVLYHISHKFVLGIESNYLQAGFKYSMQNEFYPGGTIGYEVDDKLNVRTLHAGIKVGYKF